MSLVPLRTIVLAIGGAAVVGLASGATAQFLSDQNPPEVRVLDNTTPSPSQSSSSTPSTTPSSSGTKVTASADKSSAAPMERIGIEGKVTPAASGVAVQVQRDRDGEWGDFPASSVTSANGAYSLWVQVGVKGDQSFRIVTRVDGKSVVSEPVVVRIG